MKSEFIIKLHDAWKDIKKYQKRFAGKLYGSTPFANYGDFKEYVITSLTNKGKLSKSKLTKGFVHTTKMKLRYKVSYKVAKNAYEVTQKHRTYYGEIGDLRRKSTTELAEIMKDEIKLDYKKLHGDSYEKQRQIAEMYFGS